MQTPGLAGAVAVNPAAGQDERATKTEGEIVTETIVIPCCVECGEPLPEGGEGHCFDCFLDTAFVELADTQTEAT